MITDETGSFFHNVDKASRRQAKTKTISFSVDTGYTQRLVNGINTIEEVYTVNFVNRTEADINELIQFFESLEGVTPFAFSPPHLNEYASSTATSFSGSSGLIENTGGGYSATILTPSTPDMLIVRNSISNDGFYTMDSGITSTDTALRTVGSRTLEVLTSGVIVYAAIAVVATDWTQVYTRDSINGLSATFKRVYGN